VTTVFIGGSRAVSQLDENVKSRIDNISKQGYVINVGDANGIDRLVQRHLVDQGYQHVVVFCTGSASRNNLGNWEARLIKAPHSVKDFSFYSAKDLAMAENADYGFMIWDGKSIGTLNNILNLLKQGKTTLVYFVEHKQFWPVSNPGDLVKLLKYCDSKAMAAFERKLKLSQALQLGSSQEPVGRQLDLTP
jgi:hypothetical protein